VIGVALEDAGVVAVGIGDGGVEARAAARADGDLSGAAALAVAEVGASAASAVGIASAIPDAPSIVAAVANLSQRAMLAGLAIETAVPGDDAAAIGVARLAGRARP
jgi:hypothetical protein